MCGTLLRGAFAGLVLTTGGLAADGLVAKTDWPQWRGLARDGQTAALRFISVDPAAWPKELKQVWKVEVGEGYSSPVVAGETVFQLSRENDDEVVRALRLADGKELWVQRYAAAYEMNTYARPAGKGPKSTPIVADGCLITLGIAGRLSAWDAESGKPLWHDDFAKQFKAAAPIYGAAMSPAVENGLVFVHVGGHDKGAFCAFELKTGKLRWQWNGDGPAYSSPMLTTIDGVRQIITQSQTRSIGLNAADGTLLWALPYETEYQQNSITPLVLGDFVVFAGVNKGVTAYRIARKDGAWSPERVWHNAAVSMYMSTAVAEGEHLFGFTHQRKGEFVCLRLSDGKTAWTSDGRQGDNAALLCARSMSVGYKPTINEPRKEYHPSAVLLALTTGGELLVFQVNATQFVPITRYKVGESATWAHPAVLHNQVLVKDATTLRLWALEFP